MRRILLSIVPKTLIIVLIVVFLPIWWFRLNLLMADNAVQPGTGIVFGSSVAADGPTPITQNRLDKIIEVYNEEGIDTIIVSGTTDGEFYNEPNVMADYLIANGVPNNKIVKDTEGDRTRDTCWRAKNIYEVNEAYIVTQGFHMPRAYFLCNNKNDINAVPLRADSTTEDSQNYNLNREFFASWLAIIEGNDYEPETVTE